MAREATESSENTMNTPFFVAIEQRLRSLPNSDQLEFEGASPSEMAVLEKYAGRPFPSIYRDFLTRMGRQAGELFSGSDYSITGRNNLQFRESASKLIANRNSTFSLPDSAFVFLMHQGYQFLYFDLEEGDDPPVYLVTERNPYPRKLAEIFSTFLQLYVSDLEKIAK